MSIAVNFPRRLWALVLALVAATLAHAVPSAAELKAVYLYNFVSFVSWPADAFHHASDPLVIGVLGAPDVANALAIVANGERMQAHPLKVERLVRPADVLDCQLVYVGPGTEEFGEWAALKLRPILTVGDSPIFEAKGGIIRFVMERNHIRLRINVDQAAAARLTISSQLLRIADVRRSRAWRSRPELDELLAAEFATYLPPLAGPVTADGARNVVPAAADFRFTFQVSGPKVLVLYDTHGSLPHRSAPARGSRQRTRGARRARILRRADRQ